VTDLDSFVKEASNATRCGRFEEIGEVVGIELAVGAEGASVRVRVQCMVDSKALHIPDPTCKSSSSHSYTSL
jgi:hypothetical protein